MPNFDWQMPLATVSIQADVAVGIRIRQPHCLPGKSRPASSEFELQIRNCVTCLPVCLPACRSKNNYPPGDLHKLVVRYPAAKRLLESLLNSSQPPNFEEFSLPKCGLSQKRWSNSADWINLLKSTRTMSLEPAFSVPQETKAVFEKLFKFIGKNIRSLVERQDEPYCFRLHKNRVYYVRESLMRRATNVRA